MNRLLYILLAISLFATNSYSNTKREQKKQRRIDKKAARKESRKLKKECRNEGGSRKECRKKARANDKGSICIQREGQKLREEYNNVKAIDKFKHCTVSCKVAARCSSIGARVLGHSKEIFHDWIQGKGTPYHGDMEANREGIKIYKEFRDENVCESKCKEIHPE